jgi:hypothetical protein
MRVRGEFLVSYLELEKLSRGGVPLLWIGGTLMRRCTYLLRGGALLLSSFITLGSIGVDERWQPITLHLASHFLSHMVCPPSPSGVPPSLGIVTLCYILELALPL